MSCTTILAGKKATYNGSTMIARNDDSGSGHFTPKKFVVVESKDQPREYISVLSHVRIPLPDNPQRYTAMPNALKGKGIWAACGVNESDVAMTATETITSNPRVLGADPLVEYQKPLKDPNQHFGTDSVPRQEYPEQSGDAVRPGGIGEEDLVALVLPYIHSAREGVQRLGSLLEQYGTYEENGIAFADKDEVWWLETIGGHHWIARRVRDDCIVVMPNQLGIDRLDLNDALGARKDNMCSKDLRSFILDNHLDVEFRPVAAHAPFQTGFASVAEDDVLSDSSARLPHIRPRLLFGSRDDADHVYNTPRAWYILRCLCKNAGTYDGPDAYFKPEDDDLPWQLIPDQKVTPEDIKYVLSSHYQGTPYDPYLAYGDKSRSGAYRSIGINRNDFLGFVEIRGDMPEGQRSLEWIAFASNAFNAMAPFYTDVHRTPAYLSNTTGTVSTDNFYWSSRLIAALSDATYGKCQNVIERYTEKVMSAAHRITLAYDRKILEEKDPAARQQLCEQANDETAAMLRKETDAALLEVLDFRSNDMKNSYSRSDH